MNRQQKLIKIGECLSVIKGNDTSDKKGNDTSEKKGNDTSDKKGDTMKDDNIKRGRLELQIKDIKTETVGYLQCWIEQGNINYINKLIAAHLHHRNPNDSKDKDR